LNLQNEPLKFKNSVGKPSETAEIVVARCSTHHRHWRRVGSRATTNEDSKPVDRERLLLLYLPTLPVRTTVTCNNGINAQTAVDFNFIFSSSDLVLSLQLLFSFRFPFFSIFRRPTLRSGCLWLMVGGFYGFYRAWTAAGGR
jgi:hypothetical protein